MYFSLEKRFCHVGIRTKLSGTKSERLQSNQPFGFALIMLNLVLILTEKLFKF